MGYWTVSAASGLDHSEPSWGLVRFTYWLWFPQAEGQQLSHCVTLSLQLPYQAWSRKGIYLRCLAQASASVVCGPDHGRGPVDPEDPGDLADSVDSAGKPLPIFPVAKILQVFAALPFLGLESAQGCCVHPASLSSPTLSSPAPTAWGTHNSLLSCPPPP